MPRRLRVFLTILALGLVAAPVAHSGGGTYTFDGGTGAQQSQVRAALEASSFDWGLVEHSITIHIGHGSAAEATPGEIWLAGALLDSGRFSWGIVQHEYAHQVDFFLLDDAERAQVLTLLGGKDWCGVVPGLPHEDYGCERFASTLAWSYWESPANTMEPSRVNGESGSVTPAAFRPALEVLLSTTPDAGPKAVAVVKGAAPSVAVRAKAKAQARAKAKAKAKAKRIARRA